MIQYIVTLLTAGNGRGQRCAPPYDGKRRLYAFADHGVGIVAEFCGLVHVD